MLCMRIKFLPCEAHHGIQDINSLIQRKSLILFYNIKGLWTQNRTALFRGGWGRMLGHPLIYPDNVFHYVSLY